jgi:hypothetical protein
MPGNGLGGKNMLHFNKRRFKEEIEYFLETDKFEFDALWDVIKNVVEPTSIGDYEITSWTMAYSFEKDGHEFYFEEYYADKPSTFTLSLLPFGKHNSYDAEKLKQLIQLIEQNI